MGPSLIRTKIVILSDTHGMALHKALPEDIAANTSADVAIHCGDLTDSSQIDEFRTTLGLLRRIQAPLKLVIAGNHDFTLDTAAFKEIIKQSGLEGNSQDLLKNTYGDFEEAKELLLAAQKEGIHLLDEGTHRFTIDNGAALTVFASPFTPSVGNWGFQYHPSQGHEFRIEQGADVAITHGPPHGILDRTARGRAGSPHLFSAIAKAKPRMHCFGHIHEGWGAKMVAWRDHAGGEEASHLTHVDNDESAVIEQLSSLKAGKFDSIEDIKHKEQKAENYARQRYCTASQLQERPEGEISGPATTLFVNASIKGGGDDDDDEDSIHHPWLVEIDLPSAGESIEDPSTGLAAEAAKRKRGRERENCELEDLPKRRKSVEEFREKEIAGAVQAMIPDKFRWQQMMYKKSSFWRVNFLFLYI